MRAHIIENGVVVNTIEVESLDFMPRLVEATVGGPGWLYDGKNFSAPLEMEIITPLTPTKEQLMAQLAALSAQIQALE